MGEMAILKLLQKRYFLETETTWEQLAERVTTIYPQIKDNIIKKWFIPSSPTLMNGGTTERLGTLSSCFPMGIEDSIKGIYGSLLEGAIVTQYGGGIGYEFSSLRSSKEEIKTLKANSSGPMGFIPQFSVMLEGIKQGGKRRGAGMGILHIEHPDILDFITAKDNINQITHINLSVKIPNSFYNTLKNAPNTIHKVRTKDGVYFDLLDDKGKPITVKQLWDKIIDAAWKSAEPGIFNETIAFDRCTVTNIDKTVIANPCLRETVKILTKNGIDTLSNIKIGDLIWSSEGWTKVTNKFKTGEKEVFKYYTTAGTFESTENHEIINNGEKIPVGESDSLDVLLGEYIPRNNIYPQFVMDGLVLGDGMCHKASNNLIILCVGKNDFDYFSSEVKDFFIKKREKSFRCGWEIKTSLSYEDIKKTFERSIPIKFNKINKDELFSLLRGLYSANGSICGNRITYKTASFKMIEDLQILLSSLGIKSYYTTNNKKNVKFKNGEYQCKESYDLNITNDINKFYESIGFIQQYKMDKIKKILENKKRSNKLKTTYNIKEKESIGVFPVWDITVDNSTHTFWCNGFNISNCSEFVNIPYTSCSLGSINLVAMLDGKKFNWERYSELIGLSTRFIDHTIDVNNFPLDKIKEITLKTRPIGLGNMGLAHVLFKKEIPYNSEKAFKFAEEVNRYETLRSMQESVEMAKEKTKDVWDGVVYEPAGAYPAFDYDLFMKANARFFTKNCREIDVKKLSDDIKKYGIRNSSFTSIAPTGSISFIADVSSGMEPVFGLAYYRKIEQITKEKEYDSVYMADPIFEEYLNKNFDEKTRLKILAEVADNNGSCQTCTDIPEDMRKVFVTATDLTPKEHLYILEAVANNVSLSVSKTINLPANIDKKEISDVFLDAHDKGIIGVTVYREGSREGILVHSDTQINSSSITSIIERNAPKRPKDLPCEIHRVMYQGKIWIVFVGMYENRPFEVFAGAVEDINIPKAITFGHIVKQKSQHYSFVYDDEIIVNNIGKTFANKEHDAFARVISQELRHFIPLKFIVDVLNKSEGGITHFSKVIARTLKKYIPDGEDAGKCQQCGSKLVYFEGCMKCSNLECGFSKCG